jgi:hypothetical protein
VAEPDNAVTPPSVFLIRPHRNGWQCFEAPAVPPYFVGDESQRMAFDFAKGRLAHRHGAIQVLNAASELEQSPQCRPAAELRAERACTPGTPPSSFSAVTVDGIKIPEPVS